MLAIKHFFIALAGLTGIFALPGNLVFRDDRLNKTVISPPLPDLSEGLNRYLTTGSIEAIKPWNNGLTNEICKQWMPDNKYELYNVTLSDCERPWTVCHHNNALYHIQNVSKDFARVPVIMRSHIRAIVLLPAGNHNGNGAGNVNNIVIIIGQPTFHDFLAAISKSMDRYGFDNTVGPFSRSPKWEKATEKDPSVPNSIAQLNQQENLAQLIPVALYDKRSEKGIRELVPEWEKIQNQYEEIKKDVLPDSFTTYGEKEGLKCKNRLSDGAIVSRPNKI